MTRIKVKGFKIFRDRHGVQRCYHRATGKPIDLRKAPLGSPAFFEAVAALAAVERTQQEAKSGSLGALFDALKRSQEWARLKPRSRAAYERYMLWLAPFHDTPVVELTPTVIVGIQDTAAAQLGIRSAVYVTQTLSKALGWGKWRGWVSENPCAGLPRPEAPDSEANRPWTWGERQAVLEAAPWPMRAMFALGAYTGLRIGDAVKVPRTRGEHGEIALRTAKTGQAVHWPPPAALREILDEWERQRPKADPEAMTLCCNSRGKPWTESGFRASWAKLRARLEAEQRIGPGLTYHGLRHTVATTLREAGASYDEIALALGHSSDAMAKHYSKGADLREGMRGVVRRLDRAEIKRRKDGK